MLDPLLGEVSYRVVGPGRPELPYAEAQGQDTLPRGAADQAARHGALAQIGALGLELLQVRRVPPASREPARAVSPVTAEQLKGR